MFFLNWLYAIFEEIFSILIVLITSSVNLAKKPALATKPGTPILLIHGYLHNSSAWSFFRYRLLRYDFGPVYAINLGSPYHSINEYAERVARKARQISRETGRKDLILIGHSMGGVVCSYYALNLAPKGSVKTVITLASPLEGTKLACLGFGECAKEMKIHSPFIQDLNRKLKQNDEIPFYHAGSCTDIMICPKNSATPVHAKAVCQEWRAISHIAFLYRPDVAKAVCAFLKQL